MEDEAAGPIVVECTCRGTGAASAGGRQKGCGMARLSALGLIRYSLVAEKPSAAPNSGGRGMDMEARWHASYSRSCREATMLRNIFIAEFIWFANGALHFGRFRKGDSSQCRLHSAAAEGPEFDGSRPGRNSLRSTPFVRIQKNNPVSLFFFRFSQGGSKI